MIGIDIIETKRFAKIKKNDYKYWNKVFTQKEWEYCFSQSGHGIHLAGIFAAKEALMKVFGKKYLGRFNCIQIIHDKNGKPSARINEVVKKRVEISISHEMKYAVAVAMTL